MTKRSLALTLGSVTAVLTAAPAEAGGFSFSFSYDDGPRRVRRAIVPPAAYACAPVVSTGYYTRAVCYDSCPPPPRYYHAPAPQVVVVRPQPAVRVYRQHYRPAVERAHRIVRHDGYYRDGHRHRWHARPVRAARSSFGAALRIDTSRFGGGFHYRR